MTNGELTVIQIEQGVFGNQFGRLGRILVSPDDAHVYVSVDGNGSPGPTNPGLWVYARNASTGLLTYVQHVSPGSLSRDQFDVFDFRISPDGTRVFVAATTSVALYTGEIGSSCSIEIPVPGN